MRKQLLLYYEEYSVTDSFALRLFFLLNFYIDRTHQNSFLGEFNPITEFDQRESITKYSGPIFYYLMKQRQQLHCISTRYSIFKNPLFQQKETVAHMIDLPVTSSEPRARNDCHRDDEKQTPQDLFILKRKPSGSKKKIFSCENGRTRNPPVIDSFFDSRNQGSRSSSKKKHKIFDNYTSPNEREIVRIQPFVEPFKIKGKTEGKPGENPPSENKKVQLKQDPKVNLEARSRTISGTRPQKKKILWAGLQGSTEKMKGETIMTPEQLYTLVYRARSKRTKGKRIGSIVKKIIKGNLQ